MKQMLYKAFILVAIVTTLFSAACGKATGSASATTSTPQAITQTYTPSSLSTRAETLTPTIEQIPTNTPFPIIPIPSIGEHFMLWGGDSKTYQVWINNLKDEECYAWVCPNDIHNDLYNSSWIYVGQSDGNSTYEFPIPAQDILITWGTGNSWAFDSLIGIINGQEVPYGYTLDGQQTTHWNDGSNIPMLTLIKYDWDYGPDPSPCGIVGPNPDNNYNLTGEGGGLLVRFIGKSYHELHQNHLDPHQNAYHLNGITIIAKPADQITSTDTICP